MKHTIYALTMFALAACTSPKEKAIDRHALVTRNNPEVTAIDSLSSLSVGNGEFAYTVDATGLQTFPEVYKNGVPLGTQSQWGWHSFGNPENYKPEEALVEYDFGHGHKELYATQPKEPGRAKEASDWYRVNPHRLHLGIIGLELGNEVRPSDVQNIQQSLDMWNGIINSRFTRIGIGTSFQNTDTIGRSILHASHTPVTVRHIMRTDTLRGISQLGIFFLPGGG